jgi:4-hydroxy-3-polyprenylbenzoate decarboxylase
MTRIITALTGASGAIYAKRFVQSINQVGTHQTILISNPARDVLKEELDLDLPVAGKALVKKLCSSWDLSNEELIETAEVDKFHAPPASGSRAADMMVVIPCSMGSIARFSQGVSLNLIERSFDVMLKEKKKIIVVPRETPLNQIHLQNMLALSKLGVDIIPAMPAFYHKPETMLELVDFVVGRVLEHLGYNHSLYKKWDGLQ